MKSGRSTAWVLLFTSLVFVFGPAVGARAECTTQGALALAMAQLLNYEKEDKPEEAIKILEAIGVRPLAGWKPAECLTVEVVIRIEESVRKAMIAGYLSREQALGLVERALSAIGAAEFIPALKQSMHFLPVQEQVEPGRPPGSTILTEQGQIDAGPAASPFRPVGDK